MENKLTDEPAKKITSREFAPSDITTDLRNPLTTAKSLSQVQQLQIILWTRERNTPKLKSLLENISEVSN